MKTTQEKQGLSLAKKLYALAQQGIGGEKENAEEMLERIMKKYNLTLEDLEIETKKVFIYSYKNKEQKKFLMQVLSNVLGRNFRCRELYTSGNHMKYEISLHITDLQHVEISEKYYFFWKAYQEELELFYSAFIQRQKLYSKPEPKKETEEDEDEPEMSPAEKAKLYRIMQMMAGIERKSITKTINQKNN